MNDYAVGNEPFICIETNETTSIKSLEKRFDQLFPDRIIRLIINNEYTPFFYMGNAVWLYKKALKSPVSKFTCKVLFDQEILDYIENYELELIEFMKIDLTEFKKVKDPTLNSQQYEGVFLSNGNIHIFQQHKMNNIEDFYNEFQMFVTCEKVFDSLNINLTGILIVKTNINILGEKND